MLKVSLRLLGALLACAAAPAFATTPPQCSLPGVTVLTDPAGDESAPGGAQQDIISLSIAELASDVNKLTFTLKIASLSGTLQANGIWTVYFKVGSQEYLVDMRTDAQSVPTFGYGTSTGTQDTYVGAADSGSYAADGTITIKIANSKVGNPAAGSKLTEIYAETDVRGGGPLGPGVLVTTDDAPNSAPPGTAQYTLVGNASCGTPPPPPPQTPCALPGITVVTDPTGDQAAPGTSAQDIQSVSLAELAADTATVTFTLKVASLSGSLPANGEWNIYFTAPDKNVYFVGMDTDASSAASFNYGTHASNGIDTTTGPADGGSYSTDGYIHIKLARKHFGNPAVGAKLTAINATTFLLVGATVAGNGGGALQTIDTAPDTAPGTASYTIQDNSFCGTPPPLTPCALPGAQILIDPAGDEATPGSAKQDILGMHIAELAVDNSMLTFVLKVADTSGSLPPNGQWKIYFTAPDKNVYFVDMETDASSAVTYNYGTHGTNNIDTGAGAANSGSYGDGYVRVKLARSKFGTPAVGANLTAIYAKTFLLVGATVAGNGGGSLRTIDSAPDSAPTTPSTASYTIQGNSFCQSNPPTAVLTANPVGGAPRRCR